jgi:hypothetical protein
MNKWIHIDEREPEPKQQVLVWIEDTDYITGEPNHYCDCGWWEGKNKQWETMGDLSQYRTIKYWMPLPKSPYDGE